MRKKILFCFLVLMAIFNIFLLSNNSRVDAASSYSLFEFPNQVSYVEDLPCLYIGETMQLKLKSGFFAMSSNTSVATINSNGKITAKGYGSSLIEISDGNTTEEFTLLVKRKYSNSINQLNKFPSYQGENNMYVYYRENGDIENDLVSGLSSVSLMSENFYQTGNGWWNNISFVGPKHFGGRGAGVLSYKVLYGGNYTIDYSAWIETSIRKNPEYMTWNVDGFTTGIAKRDINGNITVLVSNIGTKESVIVDSTRYQMGTATLDLQFNEEIFMFMVSNGNGDCDEVFTEFNIVQNSITSKPLYEFDSIVDNLEGTPTINISDEIKLTLRENATISSSNTNVATVESNGVIKGVGYGSTIITVTEGNDTASFALLVSRKYDSSCVSQYTNFPSVQGENNMYIYQSNELNYVNGLNTLELMNNEFSSITSWFDGKVFANNERVYCNGTGAISFKAPIDGEYTIDYLAYLKSDVRNDSNYSTWDVDGFTTGLALKQGNEVSQLIVNVGSKESVIPEATRYQMGTVTLTLCKGEEVLFFFSSNGNGAADEISSRFYVTCETFKAFDGVVNYSKEIEKIDDISLIYVGDTFSLLTNSDVKFDSSNKNVAVVDENGEVTGIGVGTTIITVYDDFNSIQFVLAVKSKPESTQVYSQLNIPSSQGHGNFYLYSGTNGDIEENLIEGLSKAELVDNKYYVSSETAWWNSVTYLNPYRVYTSGVGILSFKVSENGNYRMDYYAYLLDTIRNDPNYVNYNSVDGFSVGLALKKANGSIEIIDFKLNDKLGLVDNATKFMMNECITYAEKDDELMFFWISNGNGDCDEINTNFSIQRVYLEGEDRPIEIVVNDIYNSVSLNEELTINYEILYYKNELIQWYSSDESVIKVDNGVVTPVSVGVASITLKVGDVEKTIFVFVDGKIEFDKNTNSSFKISMPSSLKINKMVMNNRKVSSKNYNNVDNMLCFDTDYWLDLETGLKTIVIYMDDFRYTFEVEVLDTSISETPNEPVEQPSGCSGSIVCSLIAMISVTSILLYSRKKKEE